VLDHFVYALAEFLWVLLRSREVVGIDDFFLLRSASLKEIFWRAYTRSSKFQPNRPCHSELVLDCKA
jgi:hypothetical protein